MYALNYEETVLTLILLYMVAKDMINLILKPILNFI